MFTRLLSLFQKDQFNPEVCIKLLRDQDEPLHERDTAAESLFFAEDREAAITALVSVIHNSKDDHGIRMSSATTLGAIFNEIGIDHQILDALESPYRDEVLAEISPPKEGN